MAKKKRQPEDSRDDSSAGQTQSMLEAIIGLLGRFVFPEDKLREIVAKRKKNPRQYIKAYNLCDGEHGVTEIAKEIGVAQPTLTPILSDWRDRGIVYEIMKSGGKFYKGLYKLSSKRGETGEEQKAGVKSEPNEAEESAPEVAPGESHETS